MQCDQFLLSYSNSSYAVPMITKQSHLISKVYTYLRPVAKEGVEGFDQPPKKTHDYYKCKAGICSWQESKEKPGNVLWTETESSASGGRSTWVLWEFLLMTENDGQNFCLHFTQFLNCYAAQIITYGGISPLASYPGPLTPVFVARNTNMGEGLAKLSHLQWHTWNCGGVAHSQKNCK